MGALIRAHDWSRSSLGSPETWPQSLRAMIRLILNTKHPMFIWWGPDLVQFYNDAYKETMGPERHPSALGGRGRECWAEIWEYIGPQIEYVMAGKGSTWDENRLVPLTRNGRREDVWWTYSYSPIDFDGSVGGVLVVCDDVTAQNVATRGLVGQTQRLRVLNDELKHRVKNTIAVVSAIAGQTLRGKNSDDEVSSFRSRLVAFGRAHDILTAANWASAPIHEVVNDALQPHQTGSERFIISGAEVVLGSQQALSLSLAIHELATNAIKYGALSNEEGQVRISWFEDDSREKTFHFSWEESGGPSVAPPMKKGFGSQLLTRVLASDFGANVKMTYDVAGFRFHLTAPAAHLHPKPLNAANLPDATLHSAAS